MSDRLKLAFKEASKLPQEEQDRFDAFLLAELQDEREWNARFEVTQDVLSMLAKEARSEYEAGQTKSLDDLLK